MRSISLLVVAALSTLAAEQPKVLLHRTGKAGTASISLPQLKPGIAYGFQFSLPHYPSGGELDVTLRQASTVLLHKILHAADADLASTFHLPASGVASLDLKATGIPAAAVWDLQISEWPSGAPVELEPNDTWQQATPAKLGRTMFGSADDVPYLPVKETDRAAVSTQGPDWYSYEFGGAAPKLVFFELDLMERDNIPVDIRVYRIVNGAPVEYMEGTDPVTVPHEVQALSGNKFLTRILREPGRYYVRVVANHPEYKLRTRVYDPAPYVDPRQAVKTAVDYILAAGDSWHANTPRRGGVFDRVASPHQETSLCVACHATHFPLRAAIYAARNGYPIQMRQQMQFLTERFYNNPRPFYGFEQDGAVWARVISAPANVLGRMAHLIDVYEREITGERRENFHQGVREYLKIYYKDRVKLPADETNGNTPLVSTYEVAWYAWEETHDPAVAALIEQDEIKNMVDLCYQTLALAAIDRKQYAAKIKQNADRILSLQRADGQWAMRFGEKEPSVEFQTGHALWALQAAGIPKEEPHVKKAIDFLLARQQHFGGWMDPLQSYENFRTPFRETQMSILALSAYFPADKPRAKGWNVEPAGEFQIERDDTTWGARAGLGIAPSDALATQLSLEAAGRVGDPKGLPAIAAQLGHPSKLVQRTAAWAVRQIYSRHPDTPTALLQAALKSKDDRVRWGATRVFATHFAALARRPELLDGLLGASEDAVLPVRLQAIKGTWQYWFWTPDAQVKNRIETSLLSQLGKPQHPWVSRNLREAVYNLADENIRYLYNNWVPLLGNEADRTRAIQGRLRVESALADKFSTYLRTSSIAGQKELLRALTEYELRRSDVYDVGADLHHESPPVYNRIGNDIEQIVFFGESSTKMAQAIAPLIGSPDTELARLARNAALLVRDANFPTVSRVAGPAGPARDELVQAVLRANPSPELAKGLGKAAAGTKSAATAPKAAPAAGLDEAVFERKVRPIFERKGKDGYACVQCHATHTLFNGTFRTVLNVVDTANPENSLVLKKPTSSAETEGITGSKTTAHGGGVRWEAGSAEYNTILEWIRGAKR